MFSCVHSGNSATGLATKRTKKEIIVKVIRTQDDL